MRADMATLATIVFLGLVCSTQAAAPTFSCFDPPDEGQSNPLGEGLEDVVEEECCEALVDESDIIVGRLVVWDPVNCNHGPGESAITEAPLCRAHDTDGCRFCLESCEDMPGLCITCAEITGFGSTASPSSAPTSTPLGFGFGLFSSTSFGGDTPAPLGIVPDTPAPNAAGAVGVEIPTTDITDPGNRGGSSGEGGGTTTVVGGIEPVLIACACVENMSETEAEVLAVRGKALVCDSTCLDGSDLIWGVMNCNYFALGQECRACADSCELSDDGLWLDQYEAFCKPCAVISP